MKTADDKTRIRVAMMVVANLDPTLSREEVVDKAVRGDFPSPKGKPVVAYVNHDRWVADCVCGGAELVSPGEPMLCGSCGTTSKVGFPKDAQMIEKLLTVREPPARNWFPSETADELLAQNIENGIWEDK